MKQAVLKVIQNFLFKRSLAITRINVNLGRKSHITLSDKMDLTRMATLDLLVDEILQKKVEGDIAELGVYRGDFAKYLNQVFPDRDLHLFDTFSGFDAKDLEVEKRNNFSEGDENFSDTSVAKVSDKMMNLSRCKFHVGFFPDTTNGLDSSLRFAFVSIDADLFDPILEGLKYFYPRLNKGGYIMVHDYNSKLYSGAHEAVQDFCKANGVTVVPISDGWGTAVITK